MKVLLSAYACEPGKGSEPGVGWHWALEIARLGHDVHVITRANNRDAIEVAQASGDVPDNLSFHYFDLKPWQKFWKNGNRGVHLYAILWQWGASQLALRLHASHRFDLVHHITFASIRFPSFMGRLGIRFIFGPAGGGEAAPYALRRGYPFSGKVKDMLRDVSNAFIPFDPFMRWTFAKADQIWLRGKENRAFIPRRQARKISHDYKLGLGVSGAGDKVDRKPGIGPLKVLYAGNFLYWKGMHLGLKAFARAHVRLQERGFAISLSMVGDGPEENAWRAIVEQHCATADVEWMGRVSHSELVSIFRHHDLFLFPSLHDSGGMVVVEAALQGVPCVCLDIGGPSLLVDETRGAKISVTGRTEDQVVDGLADALVRLAEDRTMLLELSQSARQWSETMTWRNAVLKIYELSDQAPVTPGAG